MSVKKDNALVGIDTIIAIIAIFIFSTLIVSLIYNNSIENIKLKQENLAMIYLTETFENIAIADYNDVTMEKMNNYIPTDAIENNFNINIELKELDNIIQEQEIIKKIVGTISYQIADKKYSYTMERMKIKE